MEGSLAAAPHSSHPCSWTPGFEHRLELDLAGKAPYGAVHLHCELGGAGTPIVLAAFSNRGALCHRHTCCDSAVEPLTNPRLWLLPVVAQTVTPADKKAKWKPLAKSLVLLRLPPWLQLLETRRRGSSPDQHVCGWNEWPEIAYTSEVTGTGMSMEGQLADCVVCADRETIENPHSITYLDIIAWVALLSRSNPPVGFACAPSAVPAMVIALGWMDAVEAEALRVCRPYRIVVVSRSSSR